MCRLITGFSFFHVFTMCSCLSKEFRSEYFEQIFRLYNLPYDHTTSKRPLYFSKFTRKYVYDLLPPNVWDEMDRQNPLLPTDKYYSKFLNDSRPIEKWQREEIVKYIHE